jgi:hypothetical protein
MKSIALAKANNTRWERQHEFVHSTAIQSRDSLQDLYNKIRNYSAHFFDFHHGSVF